jgi:hypothetical protein
VSRLVGNVGVHDTIELGLIKLCRPECNATASFALAAVHPTRKILSEQKSRTFGTFYCDSNKREDYDARCPYVKLIL